MPRHPDRSILFSPSSTVMAETGQTSTQLLHRRHSAAGNDPALLLPQGGKGTACDACAAVAAEVVVDGQAGHFCTSSRKGMRASASRAASSSRAATVDGPSGLPLRRENTLNAGGRARRP